MAWLKYHGDGSNTSSPGSTIAMSAAKQAWFAPAVTTISLSGSHSTPKRSEPYLRQGCTQPRKSGVRRVAMDCWFGQHFGHPVNKHRRRRDRSVLDMADDLDVVGEAHNGYQALEMARTLRPDVIVMDIGMQDLNGIEATRQIIAQNPRAKVIGLSTHSSEPYVISMLEAGACGYVLKDAAVDEMRRAIRVVAEGHHFLSPEIAGSVVSSRLRVRPRAVLPRLPRWHRGNARSCSSWPRATPRPRSPGGCTLRPPR